ncbi:MAG: Nif11-like leader peptide family RiPP precursor [Heliobacteriaceae bacterium]|nr:Nif11-like leader peptide family RiPP precursor [Heliobacteriaceae bacterium]MDD4588393.1 Nif11-like leader peptide family RiPP precursor [Heliobacteriaceae bacterium]
MGQKQVEAFYQKLLEDKSLKDQVVAVKESPDVMFAEVAKIAQDAGFDVTPEDVRKYLSDAQLDDQTLEQVAGGRRGCTSVCTEICGLLLGHWLGRQ